MKDAGIDTTVFKPHSTRGASTSAAKALNVPVQVIMNTAGWRSDSTFAKFYDRPVLTANNCRTVGSNSLSHETCELM